METLIFIETLKTLESQINDIREIQDSKELQDLHRSISTFLTECGERD